MQTELIVIGHATLFHGDCLDYLKLLPENSVDSVCTDPPAGISMMAREWDSDKGGRDSWIDWLASIFKEVYRVMKPGAHGLVWALPRTSHWTAMGLELAGFNIRDRIAYSYDASELERAFFGSLNKAQLELWERFAESQDPVRMQHYFGVGFPKAVDVSKQIDVLLCEKRKVIGIDRRPIGGNSYNGGNGQWKGGGNITTPATSEAAQWDGWKSSLKPAVEDYWLIRKPLDGTIAQNILKHGVGGLNIDASRIATDDKWNRIRGGKKGHGGCYGDSELYDSIQHHSGRYPAHLILDGSHAVCERFPNANGSGDKKPAITTAHEGYCRPGRSMFTHDLGSVGYRDQGSASRFFKSCPIDPFVYHSKASSADRNSGCEELEARFSPTMNNGIGGKEHDPETATPKRNIHPTCKSQELFKYFCTLLTPPAGLVLDPFMGSGTTGIAAVKLGYRFIGCEMEAEYFAIAKARIAAAQRQTGLF